MQLGTRPIIRVLASCAATILIAAGCVGAPATPSSRPTAPSVAASAVSPAPTTPPSPLATASPAPSPTPSALPALAWQVLTKTGGPGQIAGALATSDAYVAYGSDEGGSWAKSSTDGRTWSRSPLTTLVKPCPTYDGMQPDATVVSGGTDGRQFVLVGDEYAMDAVPCGTYAAVAWISSDGRSWQRSEGFGAVDGFGQAIQVWPVQGGWEALVETAQRGIEAVWASPDGLRWHQTRIVANAPDGDLSVVVAVAADGTRLLARYNGASDVATVVDGLHGGESSLERSTDGISWMPVEVHLPGGVVSDGIRPPGHLGPNQWLLLTLGGPDRENPIVLVSPDLVEWRQAPFPRDNFGPIAVTRYGYVATGGDLCGDGGVCSPNIREYFSADGLTWTPFTTSTAYSIVVDGPAGVIGLDGSKVGRFGP